MARTTTRQRNAGPTSLKPTGYDALKLRKREKAAENAKPFVHLIRKGVRCDTEEMGHATPRNRSRTRIVLEATEGFVPLWEKNTTLRWRFRESSMQAFENPAAAKEAIEELMGESILAWGNGAPIGFSKRDDAWDFEVVMKATDDCDGNGCVLASAFFPDSGRHELFLYPQMFTQSREEQIETLAHEIGHIFGLRHFFAQVSETAWPSEVFGTHSKFSIMNYGNDSRLTDDDRADLKRLYQSAWDGQLTKINGTPIRFVKAYHEIGEPAESMVALQLPQAAVLAARMPRIR